MKNKQNISQNSTGPLMKLFAILFLFVLTISGYCQDKPTMGVMEAALVGQGFDEELRPIFTSLIRGRVVELLHDSMTVVEGSKLERLITTNLKECTQADCLVKFVRLVGLDYLIETRIFYRKGAWTATLKLASASTASLLSEKTATFADEAEAQKGLPLLAESVVKDLLKPRSAVAPQKAAPVAVIAKPVKPTPVIPEAPRPVPQDPIAYLDTMSARVPGKPEEPTNSHLGWWVTGGALAVGGGIAAVLLLSDNGSSTPTTDPATNNPSTTTDVTIKWAD